MCSSSSSRNTPAFSSLNTSTSIFPSLLATTVVTAYWLEGKRVAVMRRWDALRLAALLCLLITGWQAGFDAAVLLSGLAYVLVNGIWLVMLGQGADASETLAAAK